ncbi:hypothetical protein MT349_00360 [Rathayibacter caricis]|uniref:hypothetical protein n=1 Tax=Rathayibacter caricis TaxID=110936 RepID=UPI001FB23BA6|nr:hypothetical protein [Rathayibacter caricis]MCJ1694226.1 hypothetical protein [Rathayibacter caricis]
MGARAIDVETVIDADPGVRNSVFGVLFGYAGSFRCEWVPATDAPERLKPVRTEART